MELTEVLYDLNFSFQFAAQLPFTRGEYRNNS